jgi:CheY-like chemotaxis protein/PAS domain-containing protein
LANTENEKNTVLVYSLAGLLFGLMFPVISGLIWASINDLNFFRALTVDGNVLIWTIDSAPLVLGVVFYFLGRKAKTLESLNLQKELAIKKQESELFEKNQELEAIFSSFPDILFRLGEDGTIETYRTGDQTQLLMQPSSFLGRKMADVLPPHLGSLFTKSHERALKERRIQTIQYDMALNDELRYFEARVMPTGENQILDIIRDITELKKAEKELIKTQAMIERHRGMKDLIRTYNHEINNPLTIAIGHVQNLQKEIGDHTRLEKASDALKRIAEVVKGIRELDRKEPHEIRLVPYATNGEMVKVSADKQKVEDAKILIVDDEPDIRKAIQSQFEFFGFDDTHTASSGNKAIEVLKKETFDFIVSDIMMPDGTGLDLLEWIRENGKDIPVLFVSSYSNLTENEAIELGAHALMAKPLSMKKVIDCLKEMAKKKSTAA